MSRLLIACSLVAALTTSAFGSSSPSQVRFSQPPDESSMRMPMPHPDIAPMPLPDRAAVRAKLQANRAANLMRFRAYQKKGVFPSNTAQDGKLNVWIDDFGNLCAAATIISAAGMHDLVLQVGADNNFIRLADVRQGPLMDWILTSGLTQAEIAAIQEPFMRVGRPVDMPEPIITINPKLRAKEDARLAKRYKAVDKLIVKSQRTSLDAATDRLMQRPDLAWKILEG